MGKHFVIGVLFLSFPLIAQGQPLYFNKDYILVHDSMVEILTDVIEIPGGFLAVGSSSNNYPDFRQVLCWFDTAGSLLKTTVMGGGTHPVWTATLNPLLKVDDSSAVVIFMQRNTPASLRKPYMMKITLDGKAQWIASIGDSINLTDDWNIESVFRTSDGSYLVTGYRPDKFFIIKTDSSGNILTTREYSTGEQNDIYRTGSIAQIPGTSDFLLAVLSYHYDGFYKTGRKGVVVKLDSLCNIIWTTTIDSVEIFQKFFIVGADSTHFYIGKHCLDSTGGLYFGQPKLQLMMIDTSGAMLWERSTDIPKGNTYYFNEFRMMPDSTLFWLITTRYEGSSNHQFLYKTTLTGDSLFFREVIPSHMYHFWYRLNASIPTHDRGILSVGLNYHQHPNVGTKPNVWMIKTDDYACSNSQTDPYAIYLNAQSSSTILCKPDPITLRVIVAGYEPVFQWMKLEGGKWRHLTDTMEYVGSETPVLTILETGSLSVGSHSYLCEVSNTKYRLFSDPIELTLQEAAGIEDEPEDQWVRIGETAIFRVGAAGSPPVYYRWFKDQVGLLKFDSVLIIEPVQYKDTGSYYCRVWNYCGSVNSRGCTLQINTQGAPETTSGRSVILYPNPTGGAVYLDWRNSVIPPVLVTVYTTLGHLVEEIPLKQSHNHSHASFTISTSGIFHVVIRDGSGANTVMKIVVVPE